jgi:polyhydroxyalkanoate synthesis regulator phasin
MAASAGKKRTTRKSSKASTAKAKAKPRSGKRADASSLRGDKSVEAFRDALERSVTLSRDRLQEVVDDAVKRGRMTPADANELVSNLVTRGRQYSDELMKELEKLLDQARKGVESRVASVESRVAPARKRAEKAVTRAGKRARDAAEPALAEADRLRRRAGVASSTPIAGYDSLTATQVKSRLKGLKAAELRKVRTQEKRGKARKSILDAIEKQLGG